MGIFLLFAGIILAFILPGYFINRILRNDNDFGANFIISSVILFNLIFWTGISGIKLNVISIGSLLALVNILLFAYCSWKGIKLEIDYHEFKLNRFEQIIIIPIALIILLMLVKSSIYPLPIGDQIFRWYFLPARMLETGSFSYYPPFTGSDYEKYFYTDSFPPIVSFSYFWLFALYGKPENLLVCIPVTIQFILIFTFGYRLASSIFNSERAGLFAILLTGTSTLLFYSVLLSQETGITALSTVALIYFLVRNKEPSTIDIILSSFSASLGALSREYGCIFILFGIIVILWKRMPARLMLYYIGFCFILVAPWYIRNIAITGNPFYSNPVGNLFPVNPVHVGVFEAYRNTIGLNLMNIKSIWTIIEVLASVLGIPLLLSIIIIFSRFRKIGYFSIISFILICLWIYSIGLVVLGIFHSMRLLSPLIIILAVCASGIFEVLSEKYRFFYRSAAITLSVFCFFILFLDFFVPWNPFKLSLHEWKLASGIRRQWDISQEIFLFIQAIPDNSKVLSDCANFYAELENDKKNSKGIKLIAIYSPDVRFLYDKNMSFEEGAARLRSIGINYVMIGQKQNLDFIYLRKFPFFEKLSSSAKPLIKGLLYELPAN